MVGIDDRPASATAGVDTVEHELVDALLPLPPLVTPGMLGSVGKQLVVAAPGPARCRGPFAGLVWRLVSDAGRTVTAAPGRPHVRP